MSKKLITILLVAMMVTALAPLAPVVAQSDVVVSRLEAYNGNLPAGYGTISADEVGSALIERELVLLDVREVSEYEAGHIPESFNVPIRELPANLNLLPDLDAEIIVICQGGARAMLAQAALNILGYENAKTMKGGFGAWAGEEFPTTTDAFVVEAGEAPEFDAEVFAAVETYLANLPEGFGLVRAAGLAEELVENEIILIDVRSQGEWDEQGYIEGAQHIWIDEFMANTAELPEDKDATIVVYCASSYRAGIATVMMNLLGYTDVRNLVGGFSAWVAEGLPVVGAMPAEDMAGEFDLVAYATEYVNALPENFNAIRVPELEEAIVNEPDLVLLDVRSPDEYAEGHIEGAFNVPIQEVAQHLDLLPDLEANIVVYCGSGHRSALVMEALNLLGYTNVRSLLGGQRAWLASELPISDVEFMVEAGEMPAVNMEVLPLVDEYLMNLPPGYFTVGAGDLNVELAENPIVLIDVRTDGEFAGGYIEGAIHIPFSDFMNRIDEIPMGESIVLYDNPTHRSTMAMMLLQLLGYEDVRALGGGVGAWQSAELPLVTD